MTPSYNSPPSSLRALRDRLTQAAKRDGVVFGRLQQHVAVLVVAQFMATLKDDVGEPLLLVKGGTSLELRRGIPNSRTTGSSTRELQAGKVSRRSSPRLPSLRFLDSPRTYTGSSPSSTIKASLSRRCPSRCHRSRQATPTTTTTLPPRLSLSSGYPRPIPCHASPCRGRSRRNSTPSQTFLKHHEGTIALTIS